ncbi:hypothetical protein [uncultured Martelella sp.]|uniref:hypothetical protein n=1 Tax=uncultured Martelella sp. TaxID=392331 RepID=UPI0029C87269|nr:hypothetical protein [uncultured Martelella sp.]
MNLQLQIGIDDAPILHPERIHLVIAVHANSIGLGKFTYVDFAPLPAEAFTDRFDCDFHRNAEAIVGRVKQDLDEFVLGQQFVCRG